MNTNQMTLAQQLTHRLNIPEQTAQNFTNHATKRLLHNTPNYTNLYQFIYHPCHCPPEHKEHYNQTLTHLITTHDPTTALHKIDTYRTKIQGGTIHHRALTTAITPNFYPENQ